MTIIWNRIFALRKEFTFAEFGGAWLLVLTTSEAFDGSS